MIKYFLSILFSIAFILFVTFALLWLVDHNFWILHENISSNISDVHHIESFHDASLIILTFVIACVAWIQLHGIIKTGRADFLLQIDKRYGDPAIIRARKIIHLIYRKLKNENSNLTEPQYCELLAQEINSLAEGKTRKDDIDYVYLLNFLDFLETISLFANNGHISVDDINDLMNQSLGFFFTIYEIRIRERRRKYKDDSFYQEFECLIKKLRCKKTRKCCFCYKCAFNCH